MSNYIKSVLLGAVAAFTLASSVAMASGERLWGQPSFFTANINTIPQWTDVISRFRNEPYGLCSTDNSALCWMSQWEGFLGSIADLDPYQQIVAVQREMNRANYTLDIQNWGVVDYWSIPAQFFQLHGDCEDYSISKYMSLRLIGWSPEDLRIVVLNDRNLGIDHAVLIARVGGNWYMLDNQIQPVVPIDQVHHYFPYYSINERGMWLHIT